MIQMQLALARKSDPATSHAAAAKAETFRATHEGKIYSVLCDAGSRGATYREIAEAIHMEPVAVARRLHSMMERRLIYRANETRGGCAVWWRA